MARAMQMTVPSNGAIPAAPPCVSPPPTLHPVRVTLPALSWCASPEQDPRTHLGAPAPLTSYPTPCTKSDPPLFHLRTCHGIQDVWPWGEEKGAPP